jgi:hypothetical protein
MDIMGEKAAAEATMAAKAIVRMAEIWKRGEDGHNL